MRPLIQKLISLVLLQVYDPDILHAFIIYCQRKDVLLSLRPLSQGCSREARRGRRSDTALRAGCPRTTSSRRMPKSRSRSAACASSAGNRSGCEKGPSTSDAHITARAAASGRRAHQRCNVEGWPCLIDFSRARPAYVVEGEGCLD